MFGSLLDHIYTNLAVCSALHGVIPTYYSDHNAVYLAIGSSGDADFISTPFKLCSSPQKPTVHHNPSTSKPKPAACRTKPHSSTCKSTRSSNQDPILLHVQPPSLEVKDLDSSTLDDRQNVADFFGVTIKNDAAVNPELYDHRYRQISQRLHSQTPASHIDLIEPDGKCFFRAISKELLGSEKYHHRIRKRLCQFMEDHHHTFQEWDVQGAEHFDQHIRTMRKARTWATEIEIITAATFFNTSLYEFTGEYVENHNTSMKWVRFRPLQLSPEDPPYDGCPVEGNIYLHHTWGVHYDRVYSLPQGRPFFVIYNLYGQEIPQPQTADKPMAPQGRATQQSSGRQTKQNQPALSSPFFKTYIKSCL